MELESDLVAVFDLRYCSPKETSEVAAQLKKTVQLVNGLLRSSMKADFEGKKFRPRTANR
jgi:hypothetical protein